jgi:hypothetical protein
MIALALWRSLVIAFLIKRLPCNEKARNKSRLHAMATGWKIWVLGFNSRRGLEIFLFTTASKTTLGHTQPPIQWVPGTLSLSVKLLGRETDHSHPSSVLRSRMRGAIPPLSQYVLMPWYLVKHRDNFTFTFYFHAIKSGSDRTDCRSQTGRNREQCLKGFCICVLM